MAENLAKIIGSEEDKANCPFYFKNGACRYGERCTRLHRKPTKSLTLLFMHMYQNPEIAKALAEGHQVSDDKIIQETEQFESFYAKAFLEIVRFGDRAFPRNPRPVNTLPQRAARINISLTYSS